MQVWQLSGPAVRAGVCAAEAVRQGSGSPGESERGEPDPHEPHASVLGRVQLGAGEEGGGGVPADDQHLPVLE